MVDSLALHISCCFTVSFFLFMWFDTDSVIEYAKLLKLEGFFFIKEYEEMKETVEDLSYPQYLEMHKDDFVNKILSCPYCFCTWLVIYVNIFLSFMLGFPSFKFFGFDWFLSIIIYFASSRYLNK